MEIFEKVINKISGKHKAETNTIQLIKDRDMPYIMFPEDNDYSFYQDFGYWKHIPHNLKFYPSDICNGSVILIADGYGIIEGNKFGIKGKYGNGAIYVKMDKFSAEVIEQALYNKHLKAVQV